MASTDSATQLEEEQNIRQGEILSLQNICTNLKSEKEKAVFRKAIIVMLYAHFEGFTKFALDHYCQVIDNSNSTCSEVQPAIATHALHEYFKAIRSADQGGKFLPKELQQAKDLRSLAVEKVFIENARTFHAKTVRFPNNYIDTESNLKPVILRKNLYRVGLPDNMFEQIEGQINKLLKYRNDIAHGSRTREIDEDEYNELRDSVFSMMDTLRRTIIASIDAKAYIYKTEPTS